MKKFEGWNFTIGERWAVGLTIPLALLVLGIGVGAVSGILEISQ